jgi:3-hydroxybutyryl-CoA dehydrogenase
LSDGAASSEARQHSGCPFAEEAKGRSHEIPAESFLPSTSAGHESVHDLSLQSIQVVSEQMEHVRDYRVKLPNPNRPAVVVGAGTIGRRIALMFATGKNEVRLVDSSPQALVDAQAYIEKQLPGLLAKSESPAPKITYSGDLQATLADTWLVTEAIPEHLDRKRQLFAQLDRLAPADAILASNSSSYPSSQLIAGMAGPERVVNTHYLMPPERNPVEVMSCGKTDPAVIGLLLAELPQYGLAPFHVLAESVGFIFNRIWAAIKRESLMVVAEGVSTPADVDRIFELSVGTRGGPFRLMDMVGLDVVLDIEEHYASLHPELPELPRKLLREYVSQDRLGMKSGRGFYEYGK